MNTTFSLRATVQSAGTRLKRSQVTFAIAAMSLLLPMFCRAQDDDKNDTASLRKHIDESIDWFELKTVGTNATKLTPRKVLRWDNVSRGSQVGLTVLYVGRGKPEAVCCVYPWDKNLVHEFVSLSRKGLEGKQEGVPFWTMEAGGLTFKPVPKAPIPSDTEFGRRSQMKRLARRFQGTLLGWKRDDSDRQQLRLLPRALYEYKDPKDVIDGAVFSFSMGVDPEILLLFEAIEVNGKPRWEYAVARKTSGELEVKLDDDIVWHADRFPKTNDPTLANRNVKRPLASLGEQP